MEAQVNSLKINYIDKGTGPVVLILHGWGSSCDVFSGIVDRFCNRFRFIVPDLPGCGKSAVMSEPWNIGDYSDFVLAFIKKLDIQPDFFFGHSHGGRITLYMAGNSLINPKKIVLFGSAGIVGKKKLSTRAKIKFYKTAKKVLTSKPLEKSCKGMLDSLQSKFGSADYKSAPPVLQKTLVNVVNTDLCDIMPNIKIPTLLIWGEQDTATPIENARKMESLIPDCGVCPLKGCGHYCFLEKPYDTFAILDSFLPKGEKQ